MFDVAPTELLLVIVVALVVIGPKDLPKAMRFVGKWMGKARGMARHFRAGLDTMMREAELEELEKQWREQNDAIMREFPRLDDANAPAMTPLAAGAAAPTDQEADQAAAATPAAPAANPAATDPAATDPVETHAVPPRDGPLP